MATFKRFEEIKAWQKAGRGTKQVYKVTSQERFAKDFGLRNQIQRSSVSIIANIPEGVGRHSDRDFANRAWPTLQSQKCSHICTWHST